MPHCSPRSHPSPLPALSLFFPLLHVGKKKQKKKKKKEICAGRRSARCCGLSTNRARKSKQGGELLLSERYKQKQVPVNTAPRRSAGPGLPDPTGGRAHRFGLVVVTPQPPRCRRGRRDGAGAALSVPGRLHPAPGLIGSRFLRRGGGGRPAGTQPRTWGESQLG